MEINGMLKVERVMVGSKSCILHSNCDGVQSKVVFLQLTARHEAKSLPDELTMLDEGITRPYLFVGIELDCWARCLMPWFDDAVSRDEEVGKHASDTLRYIENTLVPWLHSRYGDVPCVVGGYSLGGLFALWASCKTDLFFALRLFRRLSGLRTGPCLQKIIIHMPKGSILALGIERSMPAISEWLLLVRAYVVNTSCFFNNCQRNILYLNGIKEATLMMRQDVWREDLSGMLIVEC